MNPMPLVLHTRKLLAMLCVAVLLLAFVTTAHPGTLWSLPEARVEWVELTDLVRPIVPPQPALPPQAETAREASPRAPPLV